MLTGEKPAELHRGIIQWQYHGLQNRSWGFESLFPCSIIELKRSDPFGSDFFWLFSLYIAFQICGIQKAPEVYTFRCFIIVDPMRLLRSPRSSRSHPRLPGREEACTWPHFQGLPAQSLRGSRQELHLFRMSLHSSFPDHQCSQIRPVSGYSAPPWGPPLSDTLPGNSRRPFREPCGRCK